MTQITLGGNPFSIVGDLPTVGSTAPDSTVTTSKLEDVALSSFTGKRVLNIFPSVDTAVCATSVRTFNAKAGSMDGVTVLNISADLPFAQNRFCGAEGLDGVVTLSFFRSSFAQDYGIAIDGGPFGGLAARAVVVLDGEGKVLHAELVSEVGHEPDYDAALAAL